MVGGRQLMAWVDLGLKRSDEYRRDHSVIVPVRLPRSSEPIHDFFRLAQFLRLAATIHEAQIITVLFVDFHNPPEIASHPMCPVLLWGKPEVVPRSGSFSEPLTIFNIFYQMIMWAIDCWIINLYRF